MPANLAAALAVVFVMFLAAVCRAWWLSGRVEDLRNDLVKAQRRASRLNAENEQLSRDLSEAREQLNNVCHFADRADCDAAKTVESDEDDWTDEREVWRAYVDARTAACGAGCDSEFALSNDCDEHVAFSGARAIGQAEGMRLKTHPDERIGLRSVTELNRELKRLLGVDEAPPAVSAQEAP